MINITDWESFITGTHTTTINQVVNFYGRLYRSCINHTVVTHIKTTDCEVAPLYILFGQNYELPNALGQRVSYKCTPVINHYALVGKFQVECTRIILPIPYMRLGTVVSSTPSSSNDIMMTNTNYLLEACYHIGNRVVRLLPSGFPKIIVFIPNIFLSNNQFIKSWELV